VTYTWRLLFLRDNDMESVLDHLNEFVRFLWEQWMLVSLLGSLLLLVWYRKTTSLIPTRRASFVRR